MSELNNKITQLLVNDELPFNVNPAIRQRLNYHMELKAASAHVKQNSIFPSFGHLFSAKLLGWKLSFLSIALFMFLGYRQMNNSPSFYTNADTAGIYKTTDTVNFIPFEDSLARN